MLLLGVELFDELYSGVPTVGAAAIQRGFAISYQATAWVLLLAPSLISMAVEPVLFLLADRHPRKWFVCGGLFAMAAAALLAAAAPHPYVLAVALSIAFVAAGSGVALAQGTLMDAYPAERERVMARWMLLGLAGDLAAPALMAGLAAIALGWRSAYVVVAIGVGVWALWLSRLRFPAPTRPDDEEEPGLLEALRTALANRRLLLWLFAATLCDMLDEILVVFASLHLRDQLGAGEVMRSAVLASFVIGGAGGLALADRLMRRIAPLRLLLGASLICAAAYLAWIAAPSPVPSAVLLALVGAAAAPLYPITVAQAYAALPGRSGAVNAAGSVFTPLTLALPWVLGWIADRAGTGAALLALVTQPIGLALIALAVSWRGREGRDP
jgi:predicted MFS family arabinose efflux permease